MSATLTALMTELQTRSVPELTLLREKAIVYS